MCEFIFKLLAVSAITYAWMWYLVWEYEYYKLGIRRKRWWERRIGKRGPS